MGKRFADVGRKFVNDAARDLFLLGHLFKAS
jgi:hypothetical protein